MTSRAWLAFRVALAIVLMVGFYVFAIAVSAALLLLAYADVAEGRHPNPRLILFCLAGSGSVLWSIIPRRDVFQPPGPEITRDDERQLFDVLTDVAAATAQEMPSHVYLISDINAFVTQRGGLMGFGSRRVMGIGLPLMHAVTVQELKAIVAHEFGHYHSGDVALGPWIYKTRAAIARTMATLSKSVLRFMFAWYAHLFLRVTLAVSRRQEFIADQVAARTAGAAAMISGLRKVHAAAVAFRSYWHAELAPVFGAGYRPPVNAGFAQFLANRTVASQLQAEIAREEAQGATNPYGSHPSLRERVAALGPMPAGPAGDSRPAAALLTDVASWEQKVIGAMSLDLAALKQVDWERVADVVYADAWRRLVAEHADLIRGKAVGTMSLARQDVLPLATALGAPADASDDARLQHASWFVTAAVGLAALRHGWKIEAPLGDEILLRRGDAVFRPSSEIAAVIRGETTEDQWRSRCAALEIADLPLTEPAA